MGMFNETLDVYKPVSQLVSIVNMYCFSYNSPDICPQYVMPLLYTDVFVIVYMCELISLEGYVFVKL